MTATGRLLGVAPARISNLVAGVSVAGLMVPEAIAYAGIANVPPAHALAASVAGLVAYFCIGGSHFALVAPTSSSATVFAAAVMALEAPTLPGTATPSPLMLGLVLVCLAGPLFLAAAAARIGHLAAFISRPVLRGFAFGLLVTIRALVCAQHVVADRLRERHLKTGSRETASSIAETSRILVISGRH